ncbi:hypothetical protein PR048_024227 [Dryococelus australis]|uniref:DDE-1 domain-containing protein n=1 Tax=Dryococelus australis TaxID=614101 RepID=A0ABQ9GN08_9NEOP|nr:hypothetical protein PR048_024227 [Dryococelus australis]
MRIISSTDGDNHVSSPYTLREARVWSVNNSCYTPVLCETVTVTVTVLACVSATGVFLTPFVIFKGKNMKQEFRDNLLPGSVVFMSDSGYITIELFRKFLEHFVTDKPQGKKANLLVLGGNSTHISDPDILQFAVDNNIIMISILPHISHYIQPLDRSFQIPEHVLLRCMEQLAKAEPN